jgi:hypothetical protein
VGFFSVKIGKAKGCIMEQDPKLKEFILFQINRNIILLYKRYLNLVEDLQEEHVNMLNKLNKKVDLETLKNVDYFDENRYNYLRKKVLDLGNETLREIDKTLDFLKG